MRVNAGPSFAEEEKAGGGGTLAREGISLAERCRWKTAHREARRISQPPREQISMGSRLRTGWENLSLRVPAAEFFREGREKVPWEQRRGPRGVRCHRNRRSYFLKFAAAQLPGGRRKGARARPSLSNLGAPARAAPVPPPCRGPRAAAVPSVRSQTRSLPQPGKSGALRGIPAGGRLPWPLAGARQAEKISSIMHAAAAAPRSIPAAVRGPGLAVPSPGGGRA